MIPILRKRTQVIIGGCLLLSIFIFAALLAVRILNTPTALLYNFGPGAGRDAVADALAGTLECHDGFAQNKCFKELADAFVERGSLESVFEAMERNQDDQRIFASCHALMHFVGQAAFKHFGSVAETLKEGSHVCFAGFYHGALEGYFMEGQLLPAVQGDTEALRRALPVICTEADTGVRKDYLECLHGLGHALMFATDGELPSALTLCDSLDEGERGWCYSGVFMENSTSTTNPDHPSRYLKDDDPLYPCNALADRYAATCYTLQSMYFAVLTNGDWSENVILCMSVPESYRQNCFNGLGQNLVGYSIDTAVVKAECLNLPSGEYRDSCITGAAQAMGAKYVDPLERVSRFCDSFGEGVERMTCYRALFESMNDWTAGDANDRRRICGAIEDVQLRGLCETTQ